MDRGPFVVGNVAQTDRGPHRRWTSPRSHRRLSPPPLRGRTPCATARGSSARPSGSSTSRASRRSRWTRSPRRPASARARSSAASATATSLVRALLEHEAAFQESFIRGEAPLGPGAPPVERLVAFGRAARPPRGPRRAPARRREAAPACGCAPRSTAPTAPTSRARPRRRPRARRRLHGRRAARLPGGRMFVHQRRMGSSLEDLKAAGATSRSGSCRTEPGLDSRR